MSGLASLLAGRTPCGVLRWTSAQEVDDVAHAVTHAGWAFSHVDGWTVPGTKAAVLEALGSALGFPATYGVNLDALVDSLRDVADTPGCVLLWDGWGVLAQADACAFGLLTEILAERTTDPAGTPFAVLLRGEGPPTEVPELD